MFIFMMNADMNIVFCCVVTVLLPVHFGLAMSFFCFCFIAQRTVKECNAHAPSFDINS